MRKLPTAPIVATALLLLAACKSGTEPAPLPQVINECETGAATYCGQWTLVNDTTYFAEWEQGTLAWIRVRRFTPDSVAFYREDLAGPSTGVTGMYLGKRDGNRVTTGTVTWTSWYSDGTWTASW